MPITFTSADAARLEDAPRTIKCRMCRARIEVETFPIFKREEHCAECRPLHILERVFRSAGMAKKVARQRLREVLAKRTTVESVDLPAEEQATQAELDEQAAILAGAGYEYADSYGNPIDEKDPVNLAAVGGQE